MHTFVRICSHLYALFRSFRVHVWCTKPKRTSLRPVASFDKLPSGYWRAHVRRKGRYVSKTFRLKSEAEAWAVDTEHAVQTGKDPDAVQIDPKALFGTLIDLHIADLAEVGKPLLRSKALRARGVFLTRSCPEQLQHALRTVEHPADTRRNWALVIR